MKHKQLSHRAELLLDLRGWITLNGTQDEYINLDKAPVAFLIAAILMEANEYAHRMRELSENSPTGQVINQYHLN